MTATLSQTAPFFLPRLRHIHIYTRGWPVVGGYTSRRNRKQFTSTTLVRFECINSSFFGVGIVTYSFVRYDDDEVKGKCRFCLYMILV